MKHEQLQASQSAADTALQLRILATARFHHALTEHHIKARAFFIGLTEAERRKMAAAFAVRLGMIEQVAARNRLLMHLGEIHGDLSRRVSGGRSAHSRPAGFFPKAKRKPA